MVTTDPRDSASADSTRDLSALSAVRPATALREKILPTLREAIISGELDTDAHLPEVELAHIFGVSRTPVREALAKLQQEGLVTTIPRLGTFVRRVTADDIDEIYQIREALEVLAVSLATQSITQQQRQRLQDIMEEMTNAVSRSDDKTYAEELDVFHAVVMEASGNTRLENLYQSLIAPIRRIRRITLQRHGRLQVSLDHHLAIGAALVKGDPAAADHMRQHIQNARSVVKQVAGAPSTLPESYAGSTS